METNDYAIMGSGGLNNYQYDFEVHLRYHIL